MSSAGWHVVAALLVPSSSWATSAEEPDAHDARVARIGIYVTSLRPRVVEDEFEAEFWLWATTHDDYGDWNPLDTIEIVNATRITTRYPATLERTQHADDYWPAGTVVRWHTQKVTAAIPFHWEMHNYPFDRHTLTIDLEESVEDVTGVQYVVDRRESGLAEPRAVQEWTFSDFRLIERQSRYPTTFGDPALPHGQGSRYARVTATVDVERLAVISFGKLTTGVYVAFLIAALSFFLDPGETTLTNPRVNMLVGSVFAVLVNARAVDTSLGRGEAITLVGRIHAATLLFLFLAAIVTVASRLLVESGRHDLALRLDRRVGFWVFVGGYLALNVWLIADAAREG